MASVDSGAKEDTPYHFGGYIVSAWTNTARVMAALGVQPGQIKCNRCDHIAEREAFAYGDGKHVGRHHLHRYCPACGGSIDWYGYFSGEHRARVQGSPTEAQE